MISGRRYASRTWGAPLTHSSRRPLFNPWLEKNGDDAVVVPMGVKAEGYPLDRRSRGRDQRRVLREDGRLLADQFDGASFVRGVLRKGFDASGKRALVVGNGGVGSAIARRRWLRPRLPRRDRSPLTLTITLALGTSSRCTRAANGNGLSDEEISEVIRHAAVYAGVPAASHAFTVAAPILEEIRTRSPG